MCFVIIFRGVSVFFHCKFLSYCLFVALLFFAGGCQPAEKEPIRIGFIGGLTGRAAAVGVPARDGAMMAVNQVNRAGGIHGRKVELITKDDKQDRETGIRAVRELIEAGVPAIIGPLTSTMAVEMVPIANQSDTLIVSPTAGTVALSQLDDNFLRLRPQCRTIANKLADYVVDNRGLKRFAVLADERNSTYTSDWRHSFEKRLESRGGKIVSLVAFSSGGTHRFGELAETVIDNNPSGILILANALDTAMFAQQLMKKGVKIPLFTSEWSMTRDLLRSGGRSVEGITLFHVFNEASTKRKYLDFKELYQMEFGQEPSFPVIHGYDAMQIVLAGLQMGARTGPELKKVLLQLESFDALQSSLRFDPYGDIQRDLFLTVVKNGKFVVVQ